MKKLFLSILCVCSFTYGFAQANWTSQHLGVNQDLNKIYFKDDLTGFILGDNGTLLKTIDGGISWSSIATGVTHDLRTITFSDKQTGYINGLKTTDAGETWSVQNTTTDYSIIGSFSNKNIIAGSYSSFSGAMYKSVDFGNSWSYHTAPLSTGIYTDIWITNNIGYISSWYKGYLLKTTDAGASWTNISEVTATIDDIFAVCFDKNNSNIGLVAGNNGTLLKTTDAGNNWSSIYPSTASATFTGKALEILNQDHYIMVGSDNNPANKSKIYETTNAGVSWSLTNTSENLNDLTTTNKTYFAVGEKGLFLTKSKPSLSTSSIGTIKDLISIYPNPATTYIFIDSKYPLQCIDLYDTTGKHVKKYKGSTKKISVTDLPKGLYILSINNNSFNKKIIVK